MWFQDEKRFIDLNTGVVVEFHTPVEAYIFAANGAPAVKGEHVKALWRKLWGAANTSVHDSGMTWSKFKSGFCAICHTALPGGDYEPPICPDCLEAEDTKAADYQAEQTQARRPL